MTYHSSGCNLEDRRSQRTSSLRVCWWSRSCRRLGPSGGSCRETGVMHDDFDFRGLSVPGAWGSVLASDLALTYILILKPFEEGFELVVTQIFSKPVMGDIRYLVFDCEFRQGAHGLRRKMAQKVTQRGKANKFESRLGLQEKFDVRQEAGQQGWGRRHPLQAHTLGYCEHTWFGSVALGSADRKCGLRLLQVVG